MRKREGLCKGCDRVLSRLDLHKCKGPIKPRDMPISEINQKWPSTTWGHEEWYQAFKQDDGLFHAILDGIAGLNRKNRWS